MKILIQCPGRIPTSREDIRCFTDVLNYYLPPRLAAIVETDVITIPINDCQELQDHFSSHDVSGYDAIITLNLRFYSKIPKSTTLLLKDRFAGLFCQVHDGTRLDNDPVDITFTFKDDTDRVGILNARRERHLKFNAHMGWAADPELNHPNQDPSELRILIDHTNYGGNEVDWTKDIVGRVKAFVDSGIWKTAYKTIRVRRFDSGRVVDVDFDAVDDIQEYDRTSIPITEISEEHSKAHVFMVTHPESVGLVVLETSMAGALTVAPQGFIPKDRLDTVRHIEWSDTIDWNQVLTQIDPQASRLKALENTWDRVAANIINTLQNRITK